MSSEQDQQLTASSSDNPPSEQSAPKSRAEAILKAFLPIHKELQPFLDIFIYYGNVFRAVGYYGFAVTGVLTVIGVVWTFCLFLLPHANTIVPHLLVLVPCITIFATLPIVLKEPKKPTIQHFKKLFFTTIVVVPLTVCWSSVAMVILLGNSYDLPGTASSVSLVLTSIISFLLSLFFAAISATLFPLFLSDMAREVTELMATNLTKTIENTKTIADVLSGHSDSIHGLTAIANAHNAFHQAHIGNHKHLTAKVDNTGDIRQQPATAE